MSDTPHSMTTERLRARLRRRDCTLVDARPVDAYNGWPLRGEARGGHIETARSIPFKWTGYIDWPDIVAAKAIERGHSIVVYGYDAAETQSVAGSFIRAGYRDVSVYHGFLDEWAANPDLPMSRLERYRHLVPASWLERLIASGDAPEYDNERFIVCHAHYQNRGDYDKGHIPGAVPLDTNTLESPETWNRRSPRELRMALERLGVTHDTTVVLYGRFSFPSYDDPFPGGSAGHLGAFRCAFIMLYAGVEDVRMLNGGLQAWEDDGLATTVVETAPRPVNGFGAEIPAHPEFAVDTPEAKEILRSPDGNLVSVRSWREFIGAVSGYHYIEQKGRIPGAVFGNCGSDAYHMENYRNLDHTTREYHEIARMWADAGITADTRNAFYCGTGWRGSEAFFNAWLMGWPRVSVYDGGWFEWSGDASNPRETGPPA
jgi:thiosulfate/3-mercaptopyruvate sulfurtransferase